MLFFGVQLLKKAPSAALYHNFKDRTSPLIQASGTPYSWL